MPLRPRTIGWKLFWALGVPGLCVAVLGAWEFSRRADVALLESTGTEAEALADFVSRAFAVIPEGGSGEPGTTHRAVDEALQSTSRMHPNVGPAWVAGADGNVRRARDPKSVGEPADRLVPPEDHVQVRRTLRADEASSCAGCHGDAQAVLGTVGASVGPTPLHTKIWSLFDMGLRGIVVLFVALLGLMAVALTVFVNRPLAKLSAVMRRAESGDFLVRAESDRQDELGELGQGFNRMLAKITEMKAEEIDAHRDMERVHAELSLKTALEESNAALERRVTEQSLLFDVARSLTSTIELPELFGRISRLVHDRLRIPRFSIMLLEEDRLVVKSAFPDKGLLGISFEKGQGACGRAARTLTAVYIPDLAQDETIYERRPGERVGNGSLLTVPMVHRGTLLGVLNYERPEQDAFPKEEIELLSAVADLAAIAAKNAVLHAQTVALSITDPLTGAANRRHLFTRLETELARAARFDTPLSLLMVDIDHFKILNDTRGHRAGDEVLKRVCDVLRSATRKVDLLARYGGEEFMLLLPGVKKEEALEVAEKLRRAVAEMLEDAAEEEPVGTVTVSIGVTTATAEADTIESAVDAADAALYASKRGGRNRVTGFEPGMELHPGRERGPYAARRRRTGELVKVGS